jgi:predicted ATPase
VRPAQAARTGGRTTKLLERQAQLRDLQAALERAGQGRGTTVLVSGEAGIGKTWLLQAFAGRVADTARVFLGTCEDLLTPRTLGPFRDMAREAGGAIGGVRAEDRDAFIEGLLREMRFAQRPAVVIVEDAHWADDASLDVIRHLARRIGRLPAMLVVSYRDEELTDQHPLRRVIGALAGPAVLRLELEGLSDATVARLAVGAGLAPGPVVAAVGGNPFYLSEVLALLADGSTNAAIAGRLHLSRRTVDNHVAALLTRLDVGSRRDAVAVAAGLGLLGPRERET